jgi:endonuclease
MKSLYDQPVRILLRQMIDDLTSQTPGIFTREAAVEWFAQRFPKIKDSTVSAHLIRFSVNAPSRLHTHFRPDEDLLYKLPNVQFRRYDPASDLPPIHTKSDILNTADVEDAPEAARSKEESSEFAYESDLRDFLAKNLVTLEPGLRLYEEEDITGIEFPVGGRFIDILAIDANNDLVVIELKVSRGYDRVVGQLLRYMAWIKKHHAEESQKVRGIIAARDISEDLRLACSYLNDVSLFEYELFVKLRKIDLT